MGKYFDRNKIIYEWFQSVGIKPFGITSTKLYMTAQSVGLYCGKCQKTLNEIYNNIPKKVLAPEHQIKKRSNFYLSQEWRRIRYEVLREQGPRCCLCGRSPKDGVVLHVDHIIPISIDWSKRLDKNNLQVLCDDCNMGKSNTDCIDWKNK